MMDSAETRLTPTQQRALLQLARSAIVAHLAGLPIPAVEEPELKLAHAGAFVSLHLGELLRGCIGYVDDSRSLPEALAETAMAAASRDPRFPPLTLEELEQVNIEISILSPLQKTAAPTEITLGRHGVMIKFDTHCGLLLPQVALRRNWDVEFFLEQVCRKADLPADAWKDAKAAIFIFTAEVFSENQFRANR